MRIARSVLLSLLAVAACGPASLRAGAQTSSWQQRIDPSEIPAKPKPPPKAPGKVKSQPVAPAEVPSGALPAGAAPAAAARPALRPSLGPSTVPQQSTHEKGAGGGDPAYEAFDQGRYLTALELARKAAEEGDAVAHTLIGRIHAEGLGVPQSPATAATWYAKGAELGDIEAAFALGVLHAQGSGVERNYAEAGRYLEIAALRGHALANYNLGLLFLRGQGKAENLVRAFRHIEYAAERGIVAAQYDLGTLYTTGTGTEPNAFEGARWIGKAATAGHAEAEVEYAVILCRTDAPPGDKEAEQRRLAAEKRGAALFRSAAEKGIPVAQNRLARCHAQGRGVEADAVEAAKWHLIAKAGGVEDEVLDKLVAKLSKADRLKAEKAAAEWQDRSLIQ